MNNYFPPPLRFANEERAGADPLFQARGVLGNLRLILGVALVVTLLGTLYALTVLPVYQANMLIQIKRSMPVTGDPQAEIPASTEIEILRSRSVLAGVVDVLRLDLSVEPKRFPLTRAILARGMDMVGTPGLFGYGGYAWGAERAGLARFDIPAALFGKSFILSATGKGGFSLTQEDFGIVLSGRVGEAVRQTTPYGEVGIVVSSLQAWPGARFVVTRVSNFQAVDRLQRALIISESGKQSNVIGLSLKGSNPELITSILNAIGSEYMRQFAARQSDQTDKVLAFYNKQLRESERKLRHLDARSAGLHNRHGSAALGEEAVILSQQSVTLQEKLADAENSKAELSSRYLSAHPSMIAADERIANLERELNGIQAKRRQLAAAEQENVTLARDKQLTADINAGLLGIQQKLDAMDVAGKTSVQLVDPAETPYQAVNLGLKARIALACLAGLLAGIIASALKNALAGGRKRPPPLRYDGHFRLV